MWFGSWIKALTNSISLSNNMPNPEAVSPLAGTGTSASRWDHGHPRLTSSQWKTLDANGRATFNFTRTFDAEPGISATYRESGTNLPLVSRVESWLTNGQGLYSGVTLKFYRLQMLPSGLITITVLNNFDVSAGSNLAGIPVNCIAIQPS